jgi:hypothetical protein
MTRTGLENTPAEGQGCDPPSWGGDARALTTSARFLNAERSPPSPSLYRNQRADSGRRGHGTLCSTGACRLAEQMSYHVKHPGRHGGDKNRGGGTWEAWPSAGEWTDGYLTGRSNTPSIFRWSFAVAQEKAEAAGVSSLNTTEGNRAAAVWPDPGCHPGAWDWL